MGVVVCSSEKGHLLTTLKKGHLLLERESILEGGCLIELLRFYVVCVIGKVIEH